MGQVIVRNLDDAVIGRHKERAAALGTSLEQELRRVLTEAAQPSKAEALAFARRLRESQPLWRGPGAVEMIREDRDNDEPYR